MLIDPFMLGNKLIQHLIQVVCYQWGSKCRVIAPTRTALFGSTGLPASRKGWQRLRYNLVHHPLLTGIQLSLPLPRQLLCLLDCASRSTGCISEQLKQFVCYRPLVLFCQASIYTTCYAQFHLLICSCKLSNYICTIQKCTN